MRGTRFARAPGAAPARFIPARAGNAAEAKSSTFDDAVHPRACGERLNYEQFFEHYAGSSPRVRGTLGRIILVAGPNRFIPARAGNAVSQSPGRCTFPVHPRACGERLDPTLDPETYVGSSPRVRGTPLLCGLLALPCRFIPARAGNAIAGLKAPPALPVHPRACGERCPTCETPASATGSSPRVRGTLLVPGIDQRVQRFIPARAGNANRQAA